MNNKTSHILAASSNLLGICFLVITTLKFLHLSHATYMDESAMVALVLFMGSCIFSFLSIRAQSTKAGKLYETIADYIFLTGLVLLFLIAIFFMLNVVH